MKSMLEIKNLHAKAGEKEILKGLNLTINPGEVHVIMGPNGAGKSTLANVIFSHPDYKKTKGSIIFEGQDITEKKTNEIAKLGIFMSFQQPEEIAGISVFNFIKTAKSKISDQTVDFFEFKDEMSNNMAALSISENMQERDLNVGFSGGEKKKNEILQMLELNPTLAILDETDSGLDVDAIKTVSDGINMFMNDKKALIIITHSTKILEKLDNYFVHVLIGGKIVHSGDKKLAKEIDTNGYSKFKVK